jgi:hypothetical protein
LQANETEDAGTGTDWENNNQGQPPPRPTGGDDPPVQDLPTPPQRRLDPTPNPEPILVLLQNRRMVLDSAYVAAVLVPVAIVGALYFLVFGDYGSGPKVVMQAPTPPPPEPKEFTAAGG